MLAKEGLSMVGIIEFWSMLFWWETVGENSPYFAPTGSWDRTRDLSLSVEFELTDNYIRFSEETRLKNTGYELE